ncbi:MAG: ATP-binding cassette domain-containing protein [Acidobacteria bacterium]|nr:ATP-binding cassette domain-containing protein [Acidobacteriota bacterium]
MVFDLESNPPLPNHPFIRLVEVTKSFRDETAKGGLRVLDRVSFEVERGETVVILGRSGVGKSVTLKHVLGFLRPDSGSVWVDGREVSGMSEAELFEIRRKVTMVFQSGALFDSLTVGENIAFPLREKRNLKEEEIHRRVRELMAQVDLPDPSHLADQMPSDLSTGMKRAVAIARALAAEPEAILYDEPTTMVDPLMVQTLADLMLKLKERMRLTSLIVTHDTKLARKLADRVVFLVDGKVAFFGTVAQLDTLPHEFIREFLERGGVSLLDSSSGLPGREI